ncbi:Outer membrane protein, MIM1/TOM13, mitochondrial [Phaffia rhodozyma]|uniref:Outer membrane protein, MIM1/TOM13, mitochondrial n=1 Tax=Phaffia rhodozyma TaxID=264483 RepID=A0A0F7STT7_PHARH|nr:Outer membrane protein, MIM1/TOM13, mitochondrial [Phaffia rhodozyma]
MSEEQISYAAAAAHAPDPEHNVVHVEEEQPISPVEEKPINEQTEQKAEAAEQEPVVSQVDAEPVSEDNAALEAEVANTNSEEKPLGREEDIVQPEEEVISIPADDVLGTAVLTSFNIPPPPAPKPSSSSAPSTSTAEPLPAPIASLPDSSGPPGNSADIGPDGSPDEKIKLEKSKTEFDALNRKWKEESKIAREKAEASRAYWEKFYEEEAKRKKAAEKETKVKQEPVKAAKEAEEKSNLNGSGLAKELNLDGRDGVLGAAKIEAKVDGQDQDALQRDGKAWRGLDALDNAKPSQDQRTVGDVKLVDGQAVMTVDSAVASDPNPNNESALTSLPATTSSASSPSSAPSASKPTVDDAIINSADLPIEHYLASSTSSALTPPSLTLALFSSKYLPLRRRALLAFACLGINVLLPFIGGMMAGFGEITAKGLQSYVKETFFVGRVGLSGVGPGGKVALTTNPMPGAFP